MIPEAPFLFSAAALNASFAGLGGLLIGLRRGADLRPLDTLRLRQVVEFAFANLLLAISVQPCVVLLGTEAGFRVSGALALVVIVAALPILHLRVSRVGIVWGRWWAAAAIALTAIGAVLATATAITPSAGTYELMVVVMLARPMVTFLLVLGAIDAPEPT
jgi:hypothetical protein